MTDINPLEQLETRGGAPRPIPKRGPKPIEGEIRTVVYFMPDGDALIRYEAIDSRWATNSFYARSAFLILAVIPSVNGGDPSVQFLRSKIDLSEFMRAAVKAALTPENEIELARKVLGVTKEEIKTFVERAGVPEKLIPVKVSPEVDAQLEEGRWATVELKGETPEPPNYRLGCEDEDERPIHPDCASAVGVCGCGSG